MKIKGELTTVSKIIILFVLVAAICGVLYLFGAFGNEPVIGKRNTLSNNPGNNQTDVVGSDTLTPDATFANNSQSALNNTTVPKVGDDSNQPQDLRIALDEWHGWKPIVDANKGIKTGRDGSIYKQLGLDVNIIIENGDDGSLEKFINGEVVAFGQSVNEWPYVQAELEKAGVKGTMVLITDRSIGADALVTTKNIKSLESLAGHSVAVAEYSAARGILEWLLGAALPKDQASKVNLKFTDSPEETLEKLTNGEVDAAIIWEPYLTIARSQLGAKNLFTTKSAPNLAIDGIVFRDDYIKSHPAEVEKFIEGALQAANTMKDDLTYIKDFLYYSILSDAEIREIQNVVSFMNCADNLELLGGTSQIVYEQMAEVWRKLGVSTVANGALTGFSDEFVQKVKSKFPNDKPTSTQVTEAQKKQVVEAATTQTDYSALLKQTLTVNFQPNLAVMLEESKPILKEFSKTMKILNGAIIQVEGNIADTGIGDTEGGRALSKARAQTVIDFLIEECGIDKSRFADPIGNGITKPVRGLDPRSTEGMEANRRTDICFLALE